MTDKLDRLWMTKTKNDEWWSSFVTSPLAIAANYCVVDLPWLSPNRITLASFLTAIVSVICIVVGGTANFIAAALLIHLSHVLDCMDGQMARYRQVSSPVGSYYDRVTDQIQVTLWFGAVGYAAYAQSMSAVPLFLAFIGVAFYGLRGYVKYVAIEIETSLDPVYSAKMAEALRVPITAGLRFPIRANALWFLKEQPKALIFDEGTFIFMLSAALVFDSLTPMLWVFAVSQFGLASYFSIQNGREIAGTRKSPIRK